MPNWCDNQVTITGPESVIDKIEKIVKEDKNNAENGLLQFFQPMPKELLETEAGPIAKTKKEKQAISLRLQVPAMAVGQIAAMAGLRLPKEMKP